MSWVATLCRGGDGRRLLVSEENSTTGPQQCTDESCMVVFEGRLHTGAGDGDPAASVLQAYLRHGEEALKHLQGWFTLVVWDARVQRLFAVRDPLGVQPLFYATGDGEFRVAPMLERLLSNSRAPEPNVQAMAAHVLGRSYPSDQTLCDGISRLPPGHILSWRSGDVRVERHWQPVWDEPTVTDDQAAERLDHVLRQAVARSIEPGRPGVFLSGGLDSALVAAVTADVCRTHGQPSPLMLSALFTGTEADESSTQREVARGLGLEQLALKAEDAVENGAVLGAAIELAAEAAGPPELLQPIYDRLAVAARQKGVTVALNGAGGDELLMPPPAFARERFRALDAPALLQLGRAFLGYWPEATPRSVAHSLLIRSGFRPLLVGGVTKALTLVAPARLHSVRTARSSRSIPDWLLPGDSLREWQLEQSRTERPFFDDITLSYVQEDGYDTTSRLGVRSFAPLLEPDVVALLLNIAPSRLVAQGEAKRLARELLAPRLPRLTASWPRTVYANGLWQRALRREGVGTWVALGGTPRLAGLGLVDPTILRARIQSGQAASDPREAVQVCRALILEMWIASRILRRSS
jgi:asparagine synthetase B (glutamine-hydrolysing)